MNRQEAKKILREVLGYYNETSDELLFACPSCDHHKRKLSINLDKNAFKCWICDLRGRNIRRLIRNFGTFLQLQKWDKLSGKLDLSEFAKLFVDNGDREVKEEVSLPAEFITLAQSNMPATGKYAEKYLISRGITREDIIRWKIGYCFTGEYRGRIIIPSFDDDGDLSYFIARSYTGDSYKYKNPKVSKNIAFNELFVDWNSDVVIVEGVFDAIKAGNAVPLLGSTLRSDSRLIQKIVHNDTPVYLALDPDAEVKERKLIEMLLKYDIELYKIDVSGFEDVGEMTKEQFLERKKNASLIDGNNYILLNLLAAI